MTVSSPGSGFQTAQSSPIDTRSRPPCCPASLRILAIKARSCTSSLYPNKWKFVATLCLHQVTVVVLAISWLTHLRTLDTLRHGSQTLSTPTRGLGVTEI